VIVVIAALAASWQYVLLMCWLEVQCGNNRRDFCNLCTSSTCQFFNSHSHIALELLLIASEMHKLMVKLIPS